MNGVSLEFAEGVDREISDELLTAMTAAISSEINGCEVKTIWISSANDKHTCPSRHVSGNAVDMSRINGKKMSIHYPNDSVIKKIVDGLQDNYEMSPKRRENYGPHFKMKEGKDKEIPGHNDHIHWSVNGDHTICTFALIQRLRDVFSNIFGKDKREEICNI